MTKLKWPALTGDLASSLQLLVTSGNRSRRRTASLALIMGIGATAASLGILVGQIVKLAAGL